MIHAEPELKETIVREVIERGRTYKSLSAEYGYSTGVISEWVKKYRKECQETESQRKMLQMMEENRRLREENEELKKEADFLKKAAAFFAKGSGSSSTNS